VLPTDLVEGPRRLVWGRDTLDLEPVPPSHTSGDLVVWLRSRNAVHLGDLFQYDGYPSVGLPDGGTVEGTVRVLRDILARTNDSTLVIPGHGYPTGRTELLVWTEMLEAVTARVRAAVDAGRTEEEVVALQPTSEFDGRWGRGYLRPAAFAREVYRDLTGYYRPPR
jgi:glyoxylase-like metal-dependent hydrolase (beta-lactamase superfamily II)